MDNLDRPFGLWTAVALIVGGMIGAGIFVLPAALAPMGWTSAVGWIVAGAGVLAIAFVITGLMAKYPDEPGVMTICGDVLGLLPGRLMVWSYWMAGVVTLPVLAMTAAAYLLHIFPSAPQGQWANAIGGSIIIVVLSLNYLRGVRGAGNLQVVTTLLKLIPLVIVVAIIAWLAAAEPQTFIASKSVPFAFGQLSSALGITMFALLNFESVGMLAERVRDPARNVARATMIGLTFVLAIYFIVSTGIILAMPVDELAASKAPVALFVSRYLGDWAGNAVALFAAISAIGCLNCIVILIGELPLGMVRDGQLPPYMAPVNEHGVATRPIKLSLSLSLILLIGSVTSMGEMVIDFLLRLTTASALWLYAGICLAGLRSRTRIAAALIGLGFSVWVFYGTGLEAGGLSILLIAAALPLHFMIGGRTNTSGSTREA